MTVGVDIDAGTIALQAPMEEGVDLAGVNENDLTRKGQGLGEQDLVDRGVKSVGCRRKGLPKGIAQFWKKLQVE